jgi:dipeptidase E
MKKNNIGKIVAIGGGEIVVPGKESETLDIDKEIISLSKIARPKLLFIPTASSDSAKYVEKVEQYFGKKLNCQVDSLLLLNNKLTNREIENKILNADIIYVGGGHTLTMLKVWRKLGIDKMLIKAHKKGIVLAGLSAGSICWFRFGNSDSLKSKKPDAPMIKIKGLNLISALHCPHYDSERDRKNSLKNMMKNTPGVAIALDNCCAIEVIDRKYKIIKYKPTAKAYKVYWKNKKFSEEEIISSETLLPLFNLIKK